MIHAHLNDDNAAKQIYKEDLPKGFTSIGQETPVRNPDFHALMKSSRYRTLAGEDRLGISADAVVGCLEYNLGVIVDPLRAGGDTDRPFRDKERDVASFLGDRRLEQVDDAVRKLHTPFDHDQLLKPIAACVRQ